MIQCYRGSRTEKDHFTNRSPPPQLFWSVGTLVTIFIFYLDCLHFKLSNMKLPNCILGTYFEVIILLLDSVENTMGKTFNRIQRPTDLGTEHWRSVIRGFAFNFKSQSTEVVKKEWPLQRISICLSLLDSSQNAILL